MFSERLTRLSEQVEWGARGSTLVITPGPPPAAEHLPQRQVALIDLLDRLLSDGVVLTVMSCCPSRIWYESHCVP
jgi:hypothetical protein